MQRIIACSLFCLAALNCSRSDTLSLKSFELGYNYDDRSVITERPASTILEFSFTDIPQSQTMRDAVNAIYFAGDTLCFSAEFSRKLRENEKLESWYIGRASCSELLTLQADIVHKNRIPVDATPMERMDEHGRRTAGFSLVGSILEKTHHDVLGDPFSWNLFQETKHVLYILAINDLPVKTVIITYRINIIPSEVKKR